MKTRLLAPLLSVVASLIGGLAAFGADTNCVAPPPGMMAWWTGDASVTDLAGGNTGTPSGAVGYRDGMAGPGFWLNSSCVRVTGTFDFASSNALTIEAWVKLNPHSDYNGILSAEGCCPLRLMISPNNRIYYDPGTSWDQEVGPVITMGVFHHVAMAIQGGGTARIYLDGALVSESANGVPATLPSFGVMLIGAGQSTGNHLVQDGILDEVTLYGRALSGDEIAAIYGAGSSGKCKGSLPPAITAPASQSVRAETKVTFSVAAGGSLPLAYQWQWYGTNLPGATSPALVLPNVAGSQAGEYRVIVTNNYGAATSSVAMLTVSPFDHFAIAIGDTVANGAPDTGAGNIETILAEDEYTFTGTAGQRVFFDELTGYNGLYWYVDQPDGVQMFRQNMDNDDAGFYALPQTGTYRIRVRSTGESWAVGAYSFKVWDVPAGIDNRAENDFIGGYGYGVRFNLGVLVLRIDAAWRTDFKETCGSARYYWSFGYDF